MKSKSQTGNYIKQPFISSFSSSTHVASLGIWVSLARKWPFQWNTACLHILEGSDCCAWFHMQIGESLLTVASVLVMMMMSPFGFVRSYKCRPPPSDWPFAVVPLLTCYSHCKRVITDCSMLTLMCTVNVSVEWVLNALPLLAALLFKALQLDD